MIQNRFKSDKEEVPKAEKSTKKKKEKSLKSNKISKPFKKVISFFKNEKTHQISGLFFILFSAYLLIAFTSFIFTWKIDQSKVELGLWEYLFNSDILVENWLGKIGAYLSHLFITDWFGISSFIFVGLFFLFGFRILFKINLLPPKKTIKTSAFIILWSSLFFGYFFKDNLYFLGGAVGYESNLFLGSLLGSIGSGIFIFFVLAVFLLLNFNFSDIIKAAISKIERKENEANLTIQDDNTNELEDLSSQVDDENEDSLESSIDLSIEDSNLDDDLADELEDEDLSIELKDTANETPKAEIADDLSLEIEEPIEKEVTLSDNEINQKLKDFGEYDPKLDLSEFKMPNIDILVDHGDGKIKVDKEELEANKNRIVNTLENYNIKIQTIKATIGPTVTLYEIVPAPGVRISKIKNLEDDIALSLAALGIRIIAPIPGKGTIGIEVPNQNPDIVSMRTVIASEKFQNSKFDLPIVLGKTISNETYIFDLAKMPHLLMAGATGQGKSVGLNAILTSLLYKKHPAQLKFVLVDPKKVELTLFNKIERHYLAKLPDTEEAIITDNQKVINTLNSLCIEMDNRYELLKDAFVRNIKEYNAKFIARKLNPENGHKYLPYIVLIIDEFADLIMTAGKEVETPIARLAQLARAIGIHLIIATQRPSTNIITGSIKANFPARIAFRVTSGIDSRTILDTGGGEQLIGRGDMLMSTGSDLIRLQCAFVDTPEVEELTEFIGSQRAYPDAYLLPEYIDENSKAAGEVDLADRDALFEDAARIIVQHQQGSASLLQRRLKLGYNRAGRIIDQLEAAGIIGQFEGSKARQVLITDEMSLEQFLKEINEIN
ncbi:MAG: DNA translocase FtsK [Bacteroidetes bacterium]|nr:MAG: DNA translocase FtsK [Bacteroidota bacterium]MBL1145040.1 DNA translocase FtsK [Bacteroidota bacterium]NOG57837.1 DNA translocase FtsK [Bacteroidota bacterium]